MCNNLIVRCFVSFVFSFLFGFYFTTVESDDEYNYTGKNLNGASHTLSCIKFILPAPRVIQYVVDFVRTRVCT